MWSLYFLFAQIWILKESFCEPLTSSGWKHAWTSSPETLRCTTWQLRNVQGKTCTGGTFDRYFANQQLITRYVFCVNMSIPGRCYSYVGRTFPNGQVVSIGQNCGIIAIVEHELLHALGFWHEQSRYDRDEYVTIVNENIREGLTQCFPQLNNSYLLFV